MSNDLEIEKYLNLFKEFNKLKILHLSDLFNEDIAKRIANFINTLWINLKISKDAKIRVIENVIDLVLRSILELKVKRKRKEEECEEKYIFQKGVI